MPPGGKEDWRWDERLVGECLCVDGVSTRQETKRLLTWLVAQPLDVTKQDLLW